MKDSGISPYASITIGGKDYSLDCSIGTLRNIQNHFDKDIIIVQSDCFTMKFDDLAKLFSIGMQNAPSLEQIAQEIIDDIGIIKARALAASWLVIAVTPIEHRQKKAEEMKEMLLKIGKK